MLSAFRRYKAVVPRLLVLPRGAWRDLLAAQIRLIVAQLQLSTRPTGKLVESSAPAFDSAAVSAPRLAEARALALAIGRAAEYGVFRPACLARSIALHRLMQARGINDGRVQIGVILQDGHLAAHAWVEYSGEILGDDPHIVSRFDPLPGLSLSDASVNLARKAPPEAESARSTD